MLDAPEEQTGSPPTPAQSGEPPQHTPPLLAGVTPTMRAAQQDNPYLLADPTDTETTRPQPNDSQQAGHSDYHVTALSPHLTYRLNQPATDDTDDNPADLDMPPLQWTAPHHPGHLPNLWHRPSHTPTTLLHPSNHTEHVPSGTHSDGTPHSSTTTTSISFQRRTTTQVLPLQPIPDEHPISPHRPTQSQAHNPTSPLPI